MLELGRGLDLTPEARGAERVGQLGGEHLERDRTVVFEILREIHRGHAAAAELALDGVAPGDSRRQTIEGRVSRCHRTSSPVRRASPARASAT